jgi:hypothetical protein
MNRSKLKHFCDSISIATGGYLIFCLVAHLINFLVPGNKGYAVVWISFIAIIAWLYVSTDYNQRF